MEFRTHIHAARIRQVGVEVGSSAKRTRRGHGTTGETNDVVELRIEIVCGNLPAIRSELLINACSPILARFRFQRRISGKARIAAESLVEARFLDALAVKRSVARVAEQSSAVM